MIGIGGIDPPADTQNKSIKVEEDLQRSSELLQLATRIEREQRATPISPDRTAPLSDASATKKIKTEDDLWRQAKIDELYEQRCAIDQKIRDLGQVDVSFKFPRQSSIWAHNNTMTNALLP